MQPVGTSGPVGVDATIDLTLDPAGTTRILEEFIAREVRRTGLRRVVVGLSGGIDSAVSTYLAARALGPRQVHVVCMPHRISSPASLQDAELVIRDLGLPAETVDISPMVDGFTEVTGEVSPTRLGNVMARARMLVLFDRSARHEALVLGTSNKTELLLGYGTIFGDLASALNPLGDLYKTQVFALARYLGVPESIQGKPPSADLWPDQTDEADLGFGYDELDRLLGVLIEARASRSTAVDAGFPPRMVDDVIRRVQRSQFKRCMPVIAKLSLRSIGWDFRYPRDWNS